MIVTLTGIYRCEESVIPAVSLKRPITDLAELEMARERTTLKLACYMMYHALLFPCDYCTRNEPTTRQASILYPNIRSNIGCSN